MNQENNSPTFTDEECRNVQEMMDELSQQPLSKTTKPKRMKLSQLLKRDDPQQPDESMKDRNRSLRFCVFCFILNILSFTPITPETIVKIVSKTSFSTDHFKRHLKNVHGLTFEKGKCFFGSSSDVANKAKSQKLAKQIRQIRDNSHKLVHADELKDQYEADGLYRYSSAQFSQKAMELRQLSNFEDVRRVCTEIVKSDFIIAVGESSLISNVAAVTNDHHESFAIVAPELSSVSSDRPHCSRDQHVPLAQQESFFDVEPNDVGNVGPSVRDAQTSPFVLSPHSDDAGTNEDINSYLCRKMMELNPLGSRTFLTEQVIKLTKLVASFASTIGGRISERKVKQKLKNKKQFSMLGVPKEVLKYAHVENTKKKLAADGGFYRNEQTTCPISKAALDESSLKHKDYLLSNLGQVSQFFAAN